MFRDVDKNPPLFRGLGGRIHERLIVSVLGAN